MSCSAGSTYLVARGFYTGSAGQIVLGLVIFLLYGGMLWGVLPTDTAVSWQAHLGGALGGFLAARSRGRALRPRRQTLTADTEADHRRPVPNVHQNTAEPSQRCSETPPSRHRCEDACTSATARRLWAAFCDGVAGVI